MEVGGVFALSTEREYKVAVRISQMVPAAELVRFSNSGTEAVMAALRLARAYTKKDNYVILEGSYHGLFDAAMWYTPMEKWSQVGDPQVVPYSEGVPLATRNFAHFVQANDANQLEDVLKRHGHSIACLLIEPIMGNCLGIAAEPAYVRAARELCDRHGVVLIIDEVKTGFRVARGGVQELYGVQADLCTFAKALANGYPISVLAGREHIMRKLGKGVAHGGTCHGPPRVARGGQRLWKSSPGPTRWSASPATARLRRQSAILKSRGIAHSFVGHPSMTGLYFAQNPPRTYRDWKGSDYSFYDAVAKELHEELVLCEPDSREPWFMSAAHDDACLKDTLAGFEVAIDRTLASQGTTRRVPA
jgi:glutamate-1-semialdehyde 2,1-aminomutase